jgi:hypothetical protein
VLVVVYSVRALVVLATHTREVVESPVRFPSRIRSSRCSQSKTSEVCRRYEHIAHAAWHFPQAVAAFSRWFAVRIMWAQVAKD